MDNKTTFKLLITAVFCIFMQFSIKAAEASSKTIHVETAGTLSTLISETDKYQITNLAISGNLNGTDIRYIREMAGADVYGKPTNGKLATLDMSGANIAKGGSSYFAEDYDNGPIIGASYYTSDNEIGSFIFAKCKSLVNLILPNSVTKIADYYAFADCESIESLIIGNNVTYIGHFAFNGCTNLKKLIIPDSVTNMGTCPISCFGLTELYLGKGVKEVPFGSELGIPGCKNLEKLIVSEENPYISAIDGVLFNKDMTTLIACSPGRKSSSYTVPESVTKIQDGGFIYCSNLVSITIHENVTEIGGDVFGNCFALSEIFNNNPIPQNIINSEHWFYGVDLETCKLYVPVGSYETYRNAPGWKDFKNIIEEDISSIKTDDEDNISIISTSDGIKINVSAMLPVSIYNTFGQAVYKSVLNAPSEITLAKGVYIIRVGKETKKILVK